MEAANQYEHITLNEKSTGDNRIVILLLVKPSDVNAENIIKQFNYWHHNSGRHCGIYAIGYSTSKFNDSYRDVIEVQGVNNTTWYYSDKAFVDLKKDIQKRAEWRYSGEPELIILQTDIASRSSILNFQNKYVIDVNYGQIKGYYRSLNTFMESLINASASEVEARQAIIRATKERYSIRSILEKTISNSERIPNIAKDALLDASFILSKKT